ncbi:hypothetical protein F7725_022388 [Dissostichus mawsoni]|uniref:tRNA-specific adenosine deaminase 1 n=1 Tax=Dissostichus mawsoni TaxID=36200 RepID=A0A7J5YYS4_DISMA|nr:hypothetical protein F7725_022388 [Dissostichus mawsoni]
MKNQVRRNRRPRRHIWRTEEREDSPSSLSPVKIHLSLQKNLWRGEAPDSPGLCPQDRGQVCLGGPADPLLPGRATLDRAARVKPGRGEPTLSLSCSDKLARWGCVLGFQGALLSLYLQEASTTAPWWWGGGSLSAPPAAPVQLEFPFSQAQTELHHQAGQGRISPCGAVSPQHDGDTDNLIHSRSLKLSAVRSDIRNVSVFSCCIMGAELLTYWDYKQAAQSYQQAWQQLLIQAFPLWPRTDRGLLLFH